MATEPKSKKLARLVTLQRHLEKLAENDLAAAVRQRQEIGGAMDNVMEAITSLNELHRPFARDYAERFSRLMTKDQQLEGMQRVHEAKIVKERTKGDRLEERMRDERSLEQRAKEDESVLDLLDMTMANATPASSKLRPS